MRGKYALLQPGNASLVVANCLRLSLSGSAKNMPFMKLLDLIQEYSRTKPSLLNVLKELF